MLETTKTVESTIKAVANVFDAVHDQRAGVVGRNLTRIKRQTEDCAVLDEIRQQLTADLTSHESEKLSRRLFLTQLHHS